MRKLWFLAPFVMPVIVLEFFRLIWWMAGASWSNPSMAAVFSILIGAITGGFIILVVTI